MPTYKQRVITAIRALANPEGSSEGEIRAYLLQNDFNYVCEKISMCKKELPHLVKSKDRKHYTEYYIQYYIEYLI